MHKKGIFINESSSRKLINQHRIWGVRRFFLFSIIALFLVSSSQFAFGNISKTLPPDQLDPEIIVELEKYNETIDTSPSISNPMVQVNGEVTLVSQHPYVSVNLSIDKTDNPWNCSVEPDKFNLTNFPVDQSSMDILVTVQSPPGLENGTEQRVTIIGTWSYIQDIPGIPSPEPITGGIEPTHLYIFTYNESSVDNQNGVNGDGKKDEKDEEGEEGFIPGFEAFFLIASIVVIILIFTRKKK